MDVLGSLFEFHFMRNALLAGTLVALLGGAAGYFVVLRGQSFAAHMLSQVGFPGAAAGVLLHLSPVLGLVAFCLAAALGIGLRGDALDAGRRRESAAVGAILAFALALGLLFFRLYSGARPPGTTAATYSAGSTSANATSASQVWPSFSVYVPKPSTKSCTTNCSFFFVGAATCTS